MQDWHLIKALLGVMRNPSYSDVKYRTIADYGFYMSAPIPEMTLIDQSAILILHISPASITALRGTSLLAKTLTEESQR